MSHPFAPVRRTNSPMQCTCFVAGLSLVPRTEHFIRSATSLAADQSPDLALLVLLPFEIA